jgi:hypothetical protein
LLTVVVTYGADEDGDPTGRRIGQRRLHLVSGQRLLADVDQPERGQERRWIWHG